MDDRVDGVLFDFSQTPPKGYATLDHALAIVGGKFKGHLHLAQRQRMDLDNYKFGSPFAEYEALSAIFANRSLQRRGFAEGARGKITAEIPQNAHVVDLTDALDGRLKDSYITMIEHKEPVHLYKDHENHSV